MIDGLSEKTKVDRIKELEMLSLLRYNAYINYIAIPKKGNQRISLKEFYPIEDLDKKEKKRLTREEIEKLFNKKEPVIENGKLRGYMVRGVFQNLE